MKPYTESQAKAGVARRAGRLAIQNCKEEQPVFQHVHRHSPSPRVTPEHTALASPVKRSMGQATFRVTRQNAVLPLSRWQNAEGQNSR